MLFARNPGEPQHALQKEKMTPPPLHAGLPAAAPANPDLSALQEREHLTAALLGMLETLPRSYRGRENILLLCEAILAATPHVRLVWIGFQGGGSVTPYAAAGSCAIESDDWRLPAQAFASDGPFTQALSGDVVPSGHSQLFAPWRHNPFGCSVECALAIPLRSEKTGLGGLIVFYADRRDYFSQVGVQTFQAFSHLAEIIWKQSNLMHMATQKAQHDPLTGLMTRQCAVQHLELAMVAAEKTGQPLSILLCRLEQFGKLNELYGWLESDAILAALSQEIGTRLNVGGGRWSSTEFLYVLSGTDSRKAEQMAAELRQHFLMHPVTVNSWSIRLSVAAGSATCSREIMDADDLIQQARQVTVQNLCEPLASAPAVMRHPDARHSNG